MQRKKPLVDLRSVRNFLYIADRGSISAAAIQLRIGQPALSRQMRQLEEVLGVQLFMRNGRGVALTAVGEKLRRNLGSAVQTFDDIVVAAHAADTQASGELKLGLPPSLGERFYVDLLTTCRTLYPGIKLLLSEGYSYQLAGRIQGRTLDMGIVYDPASYHNLRVFPFFQEEGVLITPPDDENIGKPIEFEQVKDIPIISPAAPTVTRRKIEGAAAAQNIELNIKFEIDSYSAIVRLVRQGEGCALLPRSFVAEAEQARYVGCRKVVNPEIWFNMYILAGQGALPVVASLVLEVVKSIVQDYCSTGYWWGKPMRSWGI